MSKLWFVLSYVNVISGEAEEYEDMRYLGSEDRKDSNGAMYVSEKEEARRKLSEEKKEAESKLNVAQGNNVVLNRSILH